MKIAAIMPTLNSDRYFVEAIRSILSQSHANFTLFVIDGGSSDATVDICKTMQKIDRRIVLVERPGTTPTQRIGDFFVDSDFDLYLMAHSDDLCYPSRFEQQIHALESDSGALLVGSWAHYWLHEKSYHHDMHHDAGVLRYPVTQNAIIARLPFWWCFSTPTIGINGKRMRESGLKLDGRFNLASDWWFYWEAAKIGSVANISQPLISYRQHLSGHGASNRQDLSEEARTVKGAIARDIGLEDFLSPDELAVFLNTTVEYDRVISIPNQLIVSQAMTKLLDFSPVWIPQAAWREVLLDIISQLEIGRLHKEKIKLEGDLSKLVGEHVELQNEYEKSKIIYSSLREENAVLHDNHNVLSRRFDDLQEAYNRRLGSFGERLKFVLTRHR